MAFETKYHPGSMSRIEEMLPWFLADQLFKYLCDPVKESYKKSHEDNELFIFAKCSRGIRDIFKNRCTEFIFLRLNRYSKINSAWMISNQIPGNIISIHEYKIFLNLFMILVLMIHSQYHTRY